MSGHPSGDEETLTCGGRGYHSGPVCCGNTLNGECRAHCAVEEQVRCLGCEDCATPSTDGPIAPDRDYPAMARLIERHNGHLRTPSTDGGREGVREWVSAAEANLLFDALERCALNNKVEEAGTIAHKAIKEHGKRNWPSLRAAHPIAGAGEAEPVAWMVVEDTDRRMSAHLFVEAANLTAETHRIANPAHDYAVQPLYTHPATPVAVSEGAPARISEADAWLIAADTGSPQWTRLTRAVRPYLEKHMSPDEFSEMVIAYGASCVLAAHTQPEERDA